MTKRSQTVCHITTVHTVKDTRIYHKQCRSLAEAGYDVKLVVVNPTSTHSDYKGVEIIPVNIEFSTKAFRMLRAPEIALQTALKTGAGIYHFHDPEFLLAALKLKKLGEIVIYDAHEDVPNQILNKAWIPRGMRGLVSKSYRWLEEYVAGKVNAVVTVVEPIASRFQKKQPHVVLVKNYPSIDQLPEPSAWSLKNNQVCYIGDLTEVRGVKEMVGAMDVVDGKFVLGGRFSNKELRSEVEGISGWEKVRFLGFIDRAEVKMVLKASKVGLVTLHPTPSYVDSIPVKMLEYMAAGIPFVGSDFGFIREVVKEYNCGILADPLNSKEIGAAINHLLTSKESEDMGIRGREAVLQHFNWETEKSKLLKLYADLLV